MFGLLLIVVAIVLKILSSSRPVRRGSSRPYSQYPRCEPEPAPSQADYSKSYQRKYLFSRNEKSEFRKLAEWAQNNNYYVFPKVRLLDIIEPRTTNDKTLLWKIQAKHIDFLVCDKQLNVLFIIELDDGSHDRKDRAGRDEFVRQALRGAGYTLLQTRGISDAFLAGLKVDK